MEARRPAHRRCAVVPRWGQPDEPRALVRALSVRPVAPRLWTARVLGRRLCPQTHSDAAESQKKVKKTSCTMGAVSEKEVQTRFWCQGQGSESLNRA